MVRLLARFGLSHPCSTPMQVVAHTDMHTFVVLAGLCSITARCPGMRKEPEITAEQDAVCQKLYDQLVAALGPQSYLGSKHSIWGVSKDLRVPAELHGTANAHAQAAVPELRAAFGSFKHFLQLAGCGNTYSNLTLRLSWW